MVINAEKTVRLKAIGLMCASITMFSLLDALAKYLANNSGLPILQVVWIRFASNVLLNLMVFGPVILIALQRSKHKIAHTIRSIFMAATTLFNFLALNYLQLDQTVTIFFIAPLIVAALGGPLLGEWIGWRRLLAVLIGFFGVLFVTRPGFGGVHYAIIYSFGAAFTYALYSISTRYIAQLETPSLPQFSAPLAGLVLFSPPAIYLWVWPADFITWFLMILMGALGGIGHWLLVLAHRSAPAPILAPFIYVGLPSMTLLGFLLFGDLPSWWTLLGAAIIISSGGYLLWREK